MNNQLLNEIIAGAINYADSDKPFSVSIYEYCHDNNYSEDIAEQAYEFYVTNGALKAGIPLSVIKGETKLSDHFSDDYINYICNKENNNDNKQY